MALTVQSDAGTVSGADAYVSQVAFETWAENRNRSLTSYTDEAIEAAIRAATQYIDTIARFKAVQLVDGQTTEFPRAGLTNWSGHTVSGVPQRVKDATCELAWAQLRDSADLYLDLDRGGRVSSESVGPISVSYEFGAPVGKTYRAAMQLLAPYLRDPKEAHPPYVGGAAGLTDSTEQPSELTPIFSVGMHANTSE